MLHERAQYTHLVVCFRSGFEALLAARRAFVNGPQVGREPPDETDLTPVYPGYFLLKGTVVAAAPRRGFGRRSWTWKVTING